MRLWKKVLLVVIALLCASGTFAAGYYTAYRQYHKVPQFVSDVSDGYDYLAIGNSITIHPLADYWWGEWGMAASRRENDYYHVVLDELESRYGKVNGTTYNYAVWEMQSYDRAETFELLDPYLVDGVDLITLQLSENCLDLTTFDQDFESLIRHIQQKCPNAQLVVVDEFYILDARPEVSAAKASVCATLGVSFAGLSAIQDRDEFRASEGTVVSGDDGNEHAIEAYGVARHPSDEAMRYIAEAILSNVK